MKLYLVQHAEAKSKKEDPKRPLSGLGKKNIEKMAKFIVENIDIDVSSIIHSGKTRAEQTAELLEKYLKPTEGVHSSEDLRPMDDPSICSRRVMEIDEDIMIVGHLPHLSKLASLMLCGKEDNDILDFSNGCLVCLQSEEGKDWSLKWMLVPDILK